MFVCVSVFVCVCVCACVCVCVLISYLKLQLLVQTPQYCTVSVELAQLSESNGTQHAGKSDDGRQTLQNEMLHGQWRSMSRPLVGVV